jgi:IS5 family transposase
MEVASMRELIAKEELAPMILDPTVQEKTIAHSTDSKMLETDRSKVAEVAKADGIGLKQTYAN